MPRLLSLLPLLPRLSTQQRDINQIIPLPAYNSGWCPLQGGPSQTPSQAQSPTHSALAPPPSPPCLLQAHPALPLPAPSLKHPKVTPALADASVWTAVLQTVTWIVQTWNPRKPPLSLLKECPAQLLPGVAPLHHPNLIFLCCT